MTHEEQIKWMADQITKLEGQYKSAMDTTAMLVGKMKPKRKWETLRSSTINSLFIQAYPITDGGQSFARAIEAKLKEKNT